MSLTKEEQRHQTNLGEFASDVSIYLDHNIREAVEWSVKAVEELDKKRDEIENLESDARDLQDKIDDLQEQLEEAKAEAGE